MATHSSTLAWKIPWAEDLGRPQSMSCKGLDMTERLHFHLGSRGTLNFFDKPILTISKITTMDRFPNPYFSASDFLHGVSGLNN